MLKFKLKNLDGLDDATKALYKEVNGEFILDIEGLDNQNDADKAAKDLEAMKNKNEELLDELKKNKRDKKILEDEKQKKEDDKNTKDGNFEALYKSAQEKIVEKEDSIKKMIDKNNQSLIKSKVTTMAAKLCDGMNVSLIEPHIRSRFGVNEQGEIQILDASGQPSVTTQEELEKEFQSNEAFAPIIKGTSASGGGASGGSPGGAGGSNQYANTFDKLVAERENQSVKN